MLQLSAIIHDKKTTNLPTPEFHIKKKELKRKKKIIYFWQRLFLSAYFTIQLIFATIHGSYCTFGTIHEFHYTILANYYLYLQYFQQKVFNFSKISKSQMDPI